MMEQQPHHKKQQIYEGLFYPYHKKFEYDLCITDVEDFLNDQQAKIFS
jgi:hypothetical protein